MLLPRYSFCGEFNRYEQALRDCGGKERYFSAGTYICHPSKMLSDSYYIVSGMTKFSLLSDQARELVICFFGAGSIFPLIATRQEFTLEPHILQTALTEIKALTISPQAMRRMLEKNPDFAAEAIDHYGRYANLLLVRNLLSVENDSYQKVCNFLYLYQNDRPAEDSIPFTQEELASITGLTRVQIARVMARLRENHIIDSARRKICIIDVDTLRQSCLSLVQPD